MTSGIFALIGFSGFVRTPGKSDRTIPPAFTLAGGLRLRLRAPLIVVLTDTPRAVAALSKRAATVDVPNCNLAILAAVIDALASGFRFRLLAGGHFVGIAER